MEKLMTLATQTLEVIGLRRKDTATVTVELAPAQSATEMAFGSQMIDVARAAAPMLGDLVTVTFATTDAA
ncbi:MAG TPA: hypothetical protein VE913_19885 [Longimicrobium sp.]|nr:hypothetical protein [Longimicrobium sp.]